MIRERDRIQENANKYIVKNCPAIISLYERPQCALPSNYYCKDCTDCVIKQVIEKCKYCYDEVDKENDGFYSILQLFDIEEIK